VIPVLSRYAGDDPSQPKEPHQPSSGLSLPVFARASTVPTLDGTLTHAVLDGSPRLGEQNYSFGSGLGADLAARFPPKMVAKIENLEFVEMSDLLQEAWVADAAGPSSPSVKHLGRRPPVSDILVWAECFTAMAAVLSQKYPMKSLELFAYPCRIFHAARIYDSHLWVNYDQIYRRQAASRRSLDWSVEDQSLYNETFGGRAKQFTRCKFCLGESHTFDVCPEMPLVQLPVSLVSPAAAPTPPGLAPSRSPLPQQPIARSGEVCRKYNEDRCYYRQCRHTHVCSTCAGLHPALSCLHSRRDPYPRKGRGAGAS
jgi:hypothetical protein